MVKDRMRTENRSKKTHDRIRSSTARDRGADIPLSAVSALLSSLKKKKKKKDLTKGLSNCINLFIYYLVNVTFFKLTSTLTFLFNTNVYPVTLVRPM